MSRVLAELAVCAILGPPFVIVMFGALRRMREGR